MKQFRLSIGGLMALILLVAVGFAALRGASAPWASVSFAIAVTVLLAAVLGAIPRRGADRMPWIGFALFGWAYLILAFSSFGDANGVKAPPFPTMFAYEPLKRWVTPLPFELSANGSMPVDTAQFTDALPREETLLEEGPMIFIPANRLAGGGSGFSAGSGGAAPKSAEVQEQPGMMMGMAPGMMGRGGPPGGTSGMRFIKIDGGAMVMVPGGSSQIPPGFVLTRAPVVNYLQLRRILHSLGAIAFGFIGAGLGWALTPRRDGARDPLAGASG